MTSASPSASSTARKSGSFSPDALAQTGISTDLAAGPTGGGYSLDEVYAELQIPLLADVAVRQGTELLVASRYSDYDTFGDTHNSKFGFKWKPIDSLLVRGTWSEGFRAPTVADLFGGVSQSFEDYTDPCDTASVLGAGSAACLADVPADYRQPANDPVAFADGPGTQTPIPFLSGSNPNLTPETSESKTLGLVWSPGFAEGLNLSLDWWNIRIENTIVADSPTTILDDCYIRGIAVALRRCRRTFTRDPVTGQITYLSFGRPQRRLRRDRRLRLRPQLPPARPRSASSAWRGSTPTSARTRSRPTTSEARRRSRTASAATSACVPTPTCRGSRVRSVRPGARVTTRAPRRTATFASHRCSLPDYAAPDTAARSPPLNELGSNTFHDVQVRCNAPWNATIAVGANNVFEHYAAPAYDQPNSGYSYYGGFDIGRFVYMKYQQRF